MRLWTNCQAFDPKWTEYFRKHTVLRFVSGSGKAAEANGVGESVTREIERRARTGQPVPGDEKGWLPLRIAGMARKGMTKDEIVQALFV